VRGAVIAGAVQVSVMLVPVGLDVAKLLVLPGAVVSPLRRGR